MEPHGKFAEEGGLMPKAHKIFLKIISDELCEEVYKKPKPLMFCAGEEGKDSCQGDSGGGAIQAEVLVGLVSHGAGCGSHPGIYTDVRRHLDWIHAAQAEEEAEGRRPVADRGVERKKAVRELIQRLIHCHGIDPRFT